MLKNFENSLKNMKIYVKYENRRGFWGTGRDRRGMQVRRKRFVAIRFRLWGVCPRLISDAYHTGVAYTRYFPSIFFNCERGGW